MSKGSPRITIRVPAEQLPQINAAAAAAGITVSDWLRALIAEAIKKPA